MTNDNSPILVECEQGDANWHGGRAGTLTASEFKHFRASARVYKGKPNEAYSAVAQDIIYRKAFERLSGVPLRDANFETYAMRRGHELEPAARAAHERRRKIVVERAGLVLTADRKFGCSADGYIGRTGGAEYKCLTAASELLAIYTHGDISSFIDQVQGCMWVTGRTEWTFGLYCPDLAVVGMELFLLDVKRDDDYIDALELDMLKAEKEVSSVEAALRTNPLYRPPAPAATE